MFLKSLHSWAIALLGCLASCAIENDIPYPIIDGNIEEMTVEGMRGENSSDPAEAIINKNDFTVTLFVNDSVDISRLKITKLKISSEAELLPDSAACVDYEKFPKVGFASLDSIPLSSNTRVDFSKPVNFTLRTYQDYVWQVTVKQIIERKIEVEGGVIRTVIDSDTRNAKIYVSSDKSLSNIRITTLNLGGEYGKVSPDPTTVHDFSKGPQTFHVSYGWEEVSREWKVFVEHDEEGGGSTPTTGDVAPMATKATIKGSIQSGKTPVVEYKASSDTNWQTVSSSDVTVSGTSFTAVVSGLTPGTTYSYRVSTDGTAGSEQTFTTAQAIALTNGSLDEWSQDGDQWNPWKAGDTPFWGTGNKGTSIIGSNVTSPVDESVSGKAAYLGSKKVILKGLAAGNLFTGDFELDGTNGILTLGRSFNSFPSALRVHLKYQSSTITQAKDPYTSLKGQADMCHIYIALSTDIVTIRTKNGDAFDKKGSSIIAYGEYISDKDVSGSERNGYKQVDIPLEYYKTDVTPKYIIIVCTASRYGDFFTGGEESKLWLDEMELLYE